MLDVVFQWSRPMTPKLLLLSKWHYGISKPKFRAKQHISRIAVNVLIGDYFFLQPFWKYSNKLIKNAKSRMVSGKFEIYGTKYNRNRLEKFDRHVY